MSPTEGSGDQSDEIRGESRADSPRRRRIRRWMQITGVAAAGALIAAAVPAIAAATTPTVTYFACVTNSTGAIRIVAKTTACGTGKHKISWNNAGPPGVRGEPGPAGAVAGFIDTNDPLEPLGSFVTKVATLPLPAGKYMVIARADANLGGSSDTVDCDLVDSDNKFLDSTSTSLSPGQNFTATEPLTLIGAAQLTVKGNVQVQCVDDSGNTGSVDGVAITAVPVTQITQSSG
jgi:hypothetical protein